MELIDGLASVAIIAIVFFFIYMKWKKQSISEAVTDIKEAIKGKSGEALEPVKYG